MHTITQNLTTHPSTRFCLRRCNASFSHRQTRLSINPRCLWSRPRQVLTWPSLRWARSPCLLTPSMGPESSSSADTSEGSGSNVNVGHGPGHFNPAFCTTSLACQEVIWEWRENFKEQRKKGNIEEGSGGIYPFKGWVLPFRKLCNSFT